MECVILWRNTQSGRVGFISDGDGDEIAVFSDRDDAIGFATQSDLLRAFPHQIVLLDEL